MSFVDMMMYIVFICLFYVMNKILSGYLLIDHLERDGWSLTSGELNPSNYGMGNNHMNIIVRSFPSFYVV
ncbi:hypothetical protein L1987_09802 [Smallanthus sonchifolius]|uniref:Uncharacterized protein n=1 Tax=Smallanthus sonchifolius TaxID=185202 RepID=A0ACB9JQB3_9ASTR|nr:hypothetical protein L1987_09802 [Smallanthus sonchifolius]